MNKKIAALVAVSAAAAAIFVGCSCGSAVENSITDSNTIAMQSDITVSSAETFTTTALSEVVTITGKETASTTEGTTISTEKTTTGTRAIQFVGRSEARQNVVTTRAQIVTQIVVVTVTMPPATTTTTTTTVTVAETVAETAENQPQRTTAHAPDGVFHPDQDVSFVEQGVEMIIGGAVPGMDGLALQVNSTDPVHGGTSANIYVCDGFDVRTELFSYEDGSMAELITEIILTKENVYTTKGVAVGDTADKIFTAYGFERWELVDSHIYRFKTDNGTVMDFYTDGSYVTEIHYYLSAE